PAGKEVPMTDPKDGPFSFDKMAQNITEMFRMNDLMKGFDFGKSFFGAQDLAAAQQRNMDALTEANKRAAAAYQDLFSKQVSVFQAMMREGAEALSQMAGPALDAAGAEARAELARKTFEQAVTHMTEMADNAMKANQQAMDIARERIDD